MLAQRNKEPVGDRELIERVRDGDRDAFGSLWERHYSAGLRAARSIAPNLDSDDLTSEAFTRILDRLAKGQGPDRAFRPYLYQVLRNLAATKYSRQQREVELEESSDTLLVENQSLVTEVNKELARKAYATLPDRWQEILWYTEVEKLPPRQAAIHLGLTASATAALAHRARVGLRKAWLLEHAKTPEVPRVLFLGICPGFYFL